MTNRGDIFDHLEIIGKGLPIQNKPVPLIAVPTTSGTGSEVTKNAVLKSAEHGRKVSMRHDSMLPSIAIIDPCLSISCPQQVWSIFVISLLLIYLSISLSIYLSIYLSMYSSVYLLIFLSIYSSIYLSICLSFCLSDCLFFR